MELKAKKKILIYGDIMLDKYFTGKVSRISPEAPVPVVNVDNEHMTLGGSANVANNIAKLGNTPVLLGFIGKDKNAADLSNLSNKEGVQLEALVMDNPTVTKIRVIGGHQQIARLDFENPLEIDSKLIGLLEKKLNNLIQNDVSVFVISDYLKGSCTAETCQMIIDKCSKLNIPVMVDPKGSDWNKYNGAYMVTPNLKELAQVSNAEILNTDEEIKKYALPLLNKFNIKYLLVTRSEKGMILISRDETINFATVAREVFDVSGAGDTVIATVSLGVALGMGIKDAVKMANIAAGIVVSKFGTTPIYKDELLTAMNEVSSKVINRKNLLRIVEQEKQKSKKIVFTNGCFDILHKGHLSYLRDASKLGDVFVLGLNSDDSVKRLKGDDRPINNQQDRADVLSFLNFVDYITIFDEDTPLELIKAITPDVLVKGGDYKAEDVVGKDFSGNVEIIPFIEGYSTTKIIDKLK
ncbi:MAG: D-glycero-beta-D-manno-heptose-7-phosphate kinase [Candidatus Margulisbacteria bacterium]|nr:D-glycero-beta-D-manno-heptose-7-phosphate kinase [Candidatus Margulisiibacteriota bacterium]